MKEVKRKWTWKTFQILLTSFVQRSYDYIEIFMWSRLTVTTFVYAYCKLLHRQVITGFWQGRLQGWLRYSRLVKYIQIEGTSQMYFLIVVRLTIRLIRNTSWSTLLIVTSQDGTSVSNVHWAFGVPSFVITFLVDVERVSVSPESFFVEPQVSLTRHSARKMP